MLAGASLVASLVMILLFLASCADAPLVASCADTFPLVYSPVFLIRKVAEELPAEQLHEFREIFSFFDRYKEM